MLKHIGRHGEKKVVVAYNTVPNEDHMCLVIYSDSLPSVLHDEVMKVLESPTGQASKDLAEALHRNVGTDGANTLISLHRGRFLQKVQTKQIILTPNAKTSVRLDELNSILAEMAKGEQATKKLAELDAGKGFADPTKPAARNVGEPTNVPQSLPAVNQGLSDSDLGADLLNQASRMESEAKTLLAEAKRLKEEAKQYTPKKTTNVRASKKATA